MPTPAVTRPAAAATETAAAAGPAAPDIFGTPAHEPTATPETQDRLPLGTAALTDQDYGLAVDQFRAALDATDELTEVQQAEALFGLAEAYYGLGQFEAAGATFNRYLAFHSETTIEDGNRPLLAQLRLAEISAAQGSCRAALGYFGDALALAPDLAAYVGPRQATCQLALGDRPAALAAYQMALAAPAHPLQTIGLHQVLAAWALEDGAFDTALFHYERVFALADSPLTKAQALVAAGNAALQAGATVEAYERLLQAVNDYPQAYDSYQALITLVDAGVPVDEYQRGLVDYYAGAYFPGIEAFNRYLNAGGAADRPDAHLFLGRSHEAVGNLDAARSSLADYAALEPAAGLLAMARLAERSGALPEAVGYYREYVADFPEEAEAPDIAWRTAALLERAQEAEEAAAAYRLLAETFPEAAAAAEALFRAGWLAWEEGAEEQARQDWRQAAAYAPQPYGAAALLWLMRALPPDDPEYEMVVEAASELPGDSYYAFRARDMAAGISPFTPLPALTLKAVEGEEAAARDWIEAQWGVEAVLTPLPANLAQDGRWLRGKILWQLGEYREADRELTWLRQSFADNPVASYQLALAFRDAGMYRESILAAATVRDLAQADALTIPTHLARLLYPAYYAELILPLAEQYGYDPLLQFALVRQESLFNSFATSTAAAQGLSQVIPDTGRYIAAQLNWDGFENEDLYRPYVGLAFGAYYIQEQLARFDGDVYVALSAYNGGPGNAARWVAAAPDDPDRYVEIVDFPETRLYIERIYAGYAIYQRLYASEAE
jgi:soluble lytic murein transglycosylase